MLYIFYGLISLIWMGCFLAFMDSKKPTNNESNYYWGYERWDERHYWDGLMLTIFIIGIFAWWFVIIIFVISIFVSYIKELATKYLFSK